MAHFIVPKNINAHATQFWLLIIQIIWILPQSRRPSLCRAALRAGAPLHRTFGFPNETPEHGQAMAAGLATMCCPSQKPALLRGQLGLKIRAMAEQRRDEFLLHGMRCMFEDTRTPRKPVPS